MSATSHHAAAKAHDLEAEAHQNRYDPRALELPDVDTLEPLDVFSYSGRVAAAPTNPTAIHSWHAREHSAVADAHRKAAASLESFEGDACQGIAPEARAPCPLLGEVKGMSDVDGGARLWLRGAADATSVVEHMRCHIAFGRSTGHDGMPQCPLYVAGVAVSKPRPDGTVELTVESPELIPELRRRVFTHLAAIVPATGPHADHH